MAARLLNTKDQVRNIKKRLKKRLGALKKKKGRPACLACVSIAPKAASKVYAESQKRLARELGIECRNIKEGGGVSLKKVESIIGRLNNDKNVTGIMVHRPLPRHLDFCRISEMISPEKDAEGINPVNLGRIITEGIGPTPCTASACMKLIRRTGIGLKGREVVIVGHSATVGKPLSLLLLSRLATVTVCHIGTDERRHLSEHVRRAEILVAAAGRPGLIKGEWIKKRAIVIDVGITPTKEGLKGDVDFKGALGRASFITPVPGGVGPLTSIALMENLTALYGDVFKR